MTVSRDRIESAALELSVSERARLARRLLESLDEAANEDSAELQRAWDAEIQRRVSEHERDPSATINASQVVAEARAKLEQK